MSILWPFFDLDVSDDVAPDRDGVQLDLDLRTNFLPGTEAVLSVTAEGAVAMPHPDSAIADAEGVLRFASVTVPVGRATMNLVAFGECGQFASTRELFVWDGAGYPDCALSLGVEPEILPEHAPLGTITADDDVDVDTDGVQIPISVEAGRPDVSVALFVRDLANATDDVLYLDAGDDRVADFIATVPEGEVAVRAVCTWATEDLHPSSHTERFFVEP